jgi:hypothetical protein
LSTDEWLLNAAWGPRTETLEQCARRLDRFLRAIAAVDSSFVLWQRSGDRSRRPLTPDALEDLLASGTHRTDDPSHRPIPDLGWTIGLSNGLRNKASQMTITCGSTHSQVGNSLHWTLPLGGLRDGLFRLDATMTLLEAVVTSWQPDWATVVSFNHLTAQGKSWYQHTFGWMVYLSAALRPKLRPMPPPATITAYHGGKLVVAAPRAEEVTTELLEEVSGRIELRSSR